MSSLIRLVLAFSLSFFAVYGSPVLSSRCSVKESAHPPLGWVKQRPAPVDHMLELRIGLPQPNFRVLEQHLYEVSDPDHPRYGQHLSKSEVEQLVAPHPESVGMVDAWLLSHGLRPESLARSPAGDWVTLKVPIALAEAMLNTTYDVWTHETSGDALVRTLEYSLPDDLHPHIDVIQPTTMFSRTKPHGTKFHFSKRHTTSFTHEGTEGVTAPAPGGSQIKLPSGISVDASCNTTITVSCLKQLYNAVGFTSSAKNGNQIAVTGYLEEFANNADLQLFFEAEVPEAVNSSFKVVSVNGGINPQNASEAGGEANLDTQFAFGITHPTPATFFTTAGSPPFIPELGDTVNDNEPYLNWLGFVLAQENVPQAISTSYGDSEQTVPLSFAQRVCQDFAQLGARGITITFSSGDGGVGDGDPDPATQECITNDGRNATRFDPAFPASCPFVTAVGATIFIPETAVSFSGGGFSNVFPRPAYQEVAVTKFLDGLAPGTFKGLFNPNGRGIPDVSAQGDNFLVFIGGESFLIGGTSASSPTFAAFVSLLNDVRLSRGLPTLGFINPFLYSRGFAGLTDITTGHNPGCGTEGFNATEGWDAISGLGTPNFGKLSELVLEL